MVSAIIKLFGKRDKPYHMMLMISYINIRLAYLYMYKQNGSMRVQYTSNFPVCNRNI